MEKTFTFYDMEADSGSAIKATCLSCSYVTVDANFKTIEEGTFNSRLRKSRAFEVDAMLAHAIPIKKIQSEELSNGELVEKLEAKFIELAKKGTIFVGYNSSGYDQILLNHMLHLNLKWPYITSKEQFDLLPAVRTASVFEPKALNYLTNFKGNTSYKLQDMIKANNIKSEKAHDSLWDTRATKDLGHLLYKNAPEVFNASIALRKKEDVISRIKDDIFCWNEFFFARAKIFCGCYIGSTIYPNWHYLFDLRQSPEEIISIMNNREELKKKIESSPRFIRICKGNRSPIIMKKENAFKNDDEYKALGIREIERRYNFLRKHREELSVRLRDLANEKLEEKTQFEQEKKQPEENLYGLKISDDERKIMLNFNRAKEISDKKREFFNFKNLDIKKLAEMKLYEDLSENDFCKVLSKKDLNRVKNRIANWLLDKSDRSTPFTKIPEQLARLDTLKLNAENDKDDNKAKQLQDLDNYLVDKMNEFEKYL